MRIDRAYKGVSKKTLILFDDGMCDGPNLQIGEQYLMYTRPVGNGEVPSRGCNRSRHVKYADEDLRYLNALSEAAPTGRVFGRVLVRTDDYFGNDKPASGALVEVTGPMGRYTAITNAEGHYSFAGLEPAKYTVTASQPSYRMLSFEYDGKPPSTDVAARGCAVVDVKLRRTWRGAIAGRVIRSNGTPASDMDLMLIRVENRDGIESSHTFISGGVSTDERGEFTFPEVAPGRYKIVMNLYRFPTAEAPYPTIYWPAARSESEALAVEVTDAAPKQRYDFRLPPEPKSVVVNGIVLSGDGRPVAGARVYIEALPDNNLTDDDENRPETDAAGHFSFTALDGFDYRLQAMTEREQQLRSADLNFSLAAGLRSVTLVLDRPVKRPLIFNNER